MKTHITPGELAKVYRFSVYLDRDGFPKIISQEDALLAYIGSKLKDIGLNGYRIREICDWLRPQLIPRYDDEGLDYWLEDGGFELHIPLGDLKDAFNRKLKEVRDAK